MQMMRNAATWEQHWTHSICLTNSEARIVVRILEEAHKRLRLSKGDAQIVCDMLAILKASLEGK